ncbi:MAG: TPM domain-containing protein [Alphaproteobacteria bacterium]
MQITEKMRDDIRKAIGDLEKSTSGEMVCVVAQSSARYVFFPMLWAAGIALLLPLINPISALADRPPPVTFPLQSLAFLALAGLFLCTPLRYFLTPLAIRENQCQRAAFEQFFLRGLHETAHRSGVLLFVSVAERHAQIIADVGINGKVRDGVWKGIIDALTADIRNEKVHEGFLTAISSCTGILASHFPEKRKAKNELDNRLVELPQAAFIS